MGRSGDTFEPMMPAAALRQQLITLKTAALQAQAALMGLKGPDEPISAAALAKIQADVATLPEEDLPKQIARWTELRQRAINALATRPDRPS